MKKHKYSLEPEHGLQVEETLEAGDREGAIALSRYWWAWTVRLSLGAANVVDLGCGTGYGTRILSEAVGNGVSILGVDLDREGLNAARREYGGRPEVTFSEFSLDRTWQTPLGNRPYDMAVCFETLEMIKHRDLFMDQLVQSLNKDGVALFSGGLYRMDIDADPKDAYFRYSGPLLIRTLKRYFETVLPFGSDTASHPTFAYVTELNKAIRRAAQGGEPLQVGRDLIYCADPITLR